MQVTIPISSGNNLNCDCFAYPESGLRNIHSIIVLFVESDDGSPNDVHADTILKENDRITVLGDYNAICNVFKTKELFVEAES